MFEKLSEDLIYIINDFNMSQNRYITTKDVVKCCYENMQLYLLFKFQKYKNEMERNTKIHRLMKKYYIYQSEYDCYVKNCLERRKKIIHHTPILIDLLFTGCYLPYAKHSANPTKEYFQEELFADLKEIIKYIPSALYSTYGQMRCRTLVTPLYASIINDNISLDVINFLHLCTFKTPILRQVIF